jgi:hypothetical protein
MPEMDGVEYSDDDCELFCWHVREISDVIDKMAADHGRAYADHYVDQLGDVIRRRGAWPD